MSPDAHWIRPEWPAPPGVHVVSTLRTGGMSVGPYASFNLAAHVGDTEENVAVNRRMLRERARLPREPLWLEQVHGTAVVLNDGRRDVPRADASFALGPGPVCVVMTADCLPVVVADRAGTCVGIAHAGWRGLAGGVLQATISAMGRDPASLLAWLGPAIGQSAFEVGSEVRDAFLEKSPRAGDCFAANERGRFQADLYGLARIVLAASGVTSVHGGGWCTATDRARFFSFRRDGTTGRMATLAWLA